MLERHYQAPGRVLTAGQMAEPFGKSFQVANTIYSNLGTKVREVLDWNPADTKLNRLKQPGGNGPGGGLGG